MSGRRRYSPARFRHLALYILHKAGDEGMTAQQLCNVMWRCDFEAYRRLGRSITGATYVKVEDGAVPMRKKDAEAVARQARKRTAS